MEGIGGVQGEETAGAGGRTGVAKSNAYGNQGVTEVNEDRKGEGKGSDVWRTWELPLHFSSLLPCGKVPRMVKSPDFFFQRKSKFSCKILKT